MNPSSILWRSSCLSKEKVGRIDKILDECESGKKKAGRDRKEHPTDFGCDHRGVGRMAFDSLTEKLQNVFRNPAQQGKADRR